MNSFKMLASAAMVAVLASPAYALDVKLGVLTDLSGIYADLSGQGSIIAARMAVEDFGAADKGLNVEIVSADHQNKPDVASSIARQWVHQDGVNAVLDVPTSSAALAINEIVRDANALHINSTGGSSDLTGAACTAHTVHWTYDTWSVANSTARAVLESGGDSWFFVTADYAFGHAIERDASAFVTAAGGEVLGSIRHPFPGTDFSSFLLQAQSSGAKVIGLANAAGDMMNSIRQASEFGITQSGQNLAGLLVFITDVHAMGLDVAQGLMLTESFYWDLNEGTREWSERYAAAGNGNMPTMVQAGVYASVLHYLKAVEATGSTDADTVIAKMKELPTEDPLFGQGEIRADGRKIHDMYLFRVKSPEQSSGAWDYYETVATIPAAEAFRPLEEGGCPLVQ